MAVFPRVGVVDPVGLGQEVLLEGVRFGRVGDVVDVDATLAGPLLAAVRVESWQAEATALVGGDQDVAAPLAGVQRERLDVVGAGPLLVFDERYKCGVSRVADVNDPSLPACNGSYQGWANGFLWRG